jgi:hypothetical protein
MTFLEPGVFNDATSICRRRSAALIDLTVVCTARSLSV